MENENILIIKDLDVRLFTDRGELPVIDRLSLTLKAGETLGIVGESGCGKSMLASAIMGLVAHPGKVTGGSIQFEGQELVGMKKKDLRRIRGTGISMIFQEPMTSLNPVFSIEQQLSEPFIIHQGLSKKEAAEKSVDLLREVKIPNPEIVAKQYPHQLSGGMRQRVMIAMALACRPKLLIADEPTTALDVTIQAQILRLMNDLKRENGTSILFITHDLGVINQMADYVAVMYCGQVVERVPAKMLFDPKTEYSHPYTEGLLVSIPRLDTPTNQRLEAIPGAVPHPLDLPKGCKFAPRCKYATEKCHEAEPPMTHLTEEHHIRCYYPNKEERKQNVK